jgi:hypothetical protein
MLKLEPLIPLLLPMLPSLLLLETLVLLQLQFLQMAVLLLRWAPLLTANKWEQGKSPSHLQMEQLLSIADLED